MSQLSDLQISNYSEFSRLSHSIQHELGSLAILRNIPETVSLVVGTRDAEDNAVSKRQCYRTGGLMTRQPKWPKPFLATEFGFLFSDDCLQVLKHMRDETIDCVFADPPFNLGKDYRNGYDDQREESEYLEWCRAWISECCRVLKPGGAIFVYATPRRALQFGVLLSEWTDFRHWIALSMKGTYPRGDTLYPAHYSLLYFTRGTPKTFNKLRVQISTCRHCGGEIKDYGGHRNKLNPEGLNLSDFWEDTSPNRHKGSKVRLGVNELKHLIPERAILMSTNEGDIVFDPFGGGGTTYVVAQRHGRKWVGTELFDSHYIQQRMERELPRAATPTADRALWSAVFTD